MNWLSNNTTVAIDALAQHLVLALPPIALALMLSVPIGWFAHRHRRAGAVVTSASSLLYTIPSLPLFIVIPTIIGTGRRSPVNVIIALTLYGLAILVPVTVTALRDGSRAVYDASVAMGYSPLGRFWSVELPLAGQSILAGLRVVSASTISLATLGSVLGVSGLGSLFVDGFKRGIEAEIMVGLVLTVALAVLVDLILVLAGRVIMPWTRPIKPERARRGGAGRGAARQGAVA